MQFTHEENGVGGPLYGPVRDRSFWLRRLFGYALACLAVLLLSEITPEFERVEGYEHIQDSTHSQIMIMAYNWHCDGPICHTYATAVSSVVIAVFVIMNSCYEVSLQRLRLRLHVLDSFVIIMSGMQRFSWEISDPLFFGTMLAYLALLFCFPANNNWVTWLCPVLLLAVPVFDMTHVCIARIRRGKNPFSTPGKDHISHLPVRLGLHDYDVVMVLCCGIVSATVAYSGAIAAYAMAERL